MNESGDDYVRRIAAFIRSNERNLAEFGFVRRRAPRRRADSNSSAALYNPLSWFGGETSLPPKSIVMAIDTHHLFYLLIRMEALSLPIGTLDVRVVSPSRPLSYVNIFPDVDKTETISLSSFRSSFSAVSAFSLGAGWWSRPELPTVDAELKYIYSSFTKLPALSVAAPTSKVVAELANDPPNENAIPMDSFKNLQSLECTDIDPRSLLGWDNLAESLISLRIHKSGLEDVSDIFVGAVLDDQARRAGSSSRKRIRKIPAGPERHTSFYSPQIPETVPETNDDEDTAPPQTLPTSTSQLSSRKWASLRFLSLSRNDLTFFPTEPMLYLTSVTHLDLSSNLLNSVPEGLSALYNLISLNLCDNMIESVLGIYTTLGSVTFINLSRNRLESICGLERLQALERVDLRNNAIEDSAEIGRLASLPNISDIWVDGNPFTEYEENHRMTCLDLFWKEGKTITLEGSPPSFYEKRKLTTAAPEHMNASRPVSAAYSPPTIAIGAHSQAPPNSSPPAPVSVDSDAISAATTQFHSIHTVSPPVGVGVGPKGRRKKVIRIVHLDGENGSDDSASVKGGHKRTTSNGSNASKHKSSTKLQKDRDVHLDHQSFGQFVSLLAVPKDLPAVTTSLSMPQAAKDHERSTLPAEPSSSFSPNLVPPLSRLDSELRSDTFSSRSNRKLRHTRYQTDFSGAGGDADHPSPVFESTGASTGPQSPSPMRRLQRNSQTFSSTRAAARRARITASVYEPPTGGGDGSFADGEGENVADEADAFRRRIEALKQDMGDGWLKIFSQTQMKTPSPS